MKRYEKESQRMRFFFFFFISVAYFFFLIHSPDSLSKQIYLSRLYIYITYKMILTGRKREEKRTKRSEKGCLSKKRVLFIDNS
jgi:hypothetical protein